MTLDKTTSTFKAEKDLLLQELQVYRERSNSQESIITDLENK